MNYSLRKKIRHQVLNWITFSLVAVNLIPIAWMAYCGFKDNNEILAGMVKPGRRVNDVVHLERHAEGWLAGTSDGGLTLFSEGSSGADLEVKKHENLGTFATSYWSQAGFLWVLSSNKGLLKIDPATLETSAEYPASLLAELYGESWKTLWVNDVRGSSLTGTAGSGGTLYLSYDYRDFPGVTAFSIAEGKFRKVEAYVPKDMGTVRFLAAMSGGKPALGADSIAVGTKQGVFFLRLPEEKMGLAAWAGEALPDAPDRLLPLGRNTALLSLGDRAAVFDFGAARLRGWLPTEGSGASRIASLAHAGDRVWLGNSQSALALLPSAADSTGNHPADSAGILAAATQVYRPGSPSLGGAPPPSRAGEPAASPEALRDLSGTKVSAILPLPDGRVLLGGQKGIVSVLAADGGTSASGRTPAASWNFQWRNYVDLWRNVDFGLYLKNSLIICISVMLISVVMAALGGYALARFKFPGRNMFGYSILATQMIPGIMLLLPVYLMFVNFTQATGIILKGTYGGLILTYAAYFTPFSIWILRGFFASIPKELEEAALIDGCGPFKAFFRIIIPSAMPGIVATGVYVFLAAWDELMFAWVLTNEATYTIPVGIRLFVGNFQNRYDLMMAAATVATIPVMVLFFILQRQIVSGLTAGAVKD